VARIDEDQDEVDLNAQGDIARTYRDWLLPHVLHYNAD